MTAQVEAAVTVQGDYALKGSDLDQRFARFGHEALSEGELWALSMASMVLPDGHPGCGAYLSRVAGTKEYVDELKIWGRIIAIGISSAAYKARNGSRRRAYVEGFDWAWGRLAVADGLTLALYGLAPTVHDRANELRVGEQGFKRIRDFVGGTLVNCIEEYKWALGWALGFHRDRMLESRWETITGLKWGENFRRETIGSQRGEIYPLMSVGTSITKPARTDNDEDRVDPETLYPGIGASQAWDSREAAKVAPVITFKPCHGKLSNATDG